MKKRKGIKRSIVYVSLVLLCFVVSLSFLLIDYIVNREEKVLWGKSSSDFDVSYKVYTNDNKFYNADYLNEYGSYVSSVTDKIDFSVKYTFETTENLEIDYSYDIYGEVLAEVYESGISSPVWSKKLDINSENSKNLGSGNYLQLNNEISIPFKEYNDMMIEYKKNYGINVSSYVKFTVTVDVDSLKKINSNISSKDVLTIKIPLLQPTFYVDMSKSVTNNRDIYLMVENDNNDIFFQLGIFGLIFTFVVGLVLFIYYRLTRTKFDLYKSMVNGILKKYEQIIVKIDELPDVNGLQVIDIKDFDDLIDLEETLKIPIMYLNVYENRESWFILINDKYFYKYIVKIKK